MEHVDVVVVGAGLSGIGAGYHLQERCPGTTYVILEARAAIGGTWDLFRYPGIRSDSDMSTLGYGFRPWSGGWMIADGGAIAAYIRETARVYGIDRHVRFGHRMTRAAWSSTDAAWTLDVETSAGPSRLSCRFLYMCSGYYASEDGYTPALPGLATFGGPVVHPQHWPEDIALAGRRVVVIGSGSTAITLVPALAREAAHVTMLQRSPTYVVAVPSRDVMAVALARVLPARYAFQLVRWRNILAQMAVYQLARRAPALARRVLVGRVRAHLPEGYDVARHFTPRYAPWDERLCVDPDGALFAAIRAGSVTVETDEIAQVTPAGVALRSGRHLEADVLVTATGLVLRLLGGARLEVDGTPVDLTRTLSYKGLMFSDVPNLASSFGYTNASWTLKSDLIAGYVCRLLQHMDRHGYVRCVPRRADDAGPEQALLNLTAGYVRRGGNLPRQGSRPPWRSHQNYLRDLHELRFRHVDDGTLEFARRDTAGG